MELPAMLTLVSSITTAVAFLIKIGADEVRNTRREERRVADKELAAVTVGHTDNKLTEIKDQTNGNNDKLQLALTASTIQVGRLEGKIEGLQALVEGLRAIRATTRATDIIPPPTPPLPGS